MLFFGSKRNNLSEISKDKEAMNTEIKNTKHGINNLEKLWPVS